MPRIYPGTEPSENKARHPVEETQAPAKQKPPKTDEKKKGGG